MTITKRGSSSNRSVGSINSATTPLVIATPGPVAGSLLFVADWIAQGLGGTQTVPAPANMTKVSTDGVNPERTGGLHVAKVTDPSVFAGGIQCNSNSTTSRVVGIAQAWDPDPGYEWDMSSIVVGGPEYLGTSSTSDTAPALPGGVTRDLTLVVIMTNKGANTLLTQHNATGGGTDGDQAISPSAATNGPPNSVSVSDSVLSIFRGGTGVNFVQGNGGGDGTTALAQANTLAYTFGINQIPVGGGGLPTVTGHGFTSVEQFLQTSGATMAHRNRGGTYPEMTEYGIRMAANLGDGIIEISCQRTSDGVWVGCHDQTLDRVAVETTYDGQQISTLTGAQVLGLTVNTGSSGAPQPFATLQTLVGTLPSDFIFMVDPKQAGGTTAYLNDFLDILDGLGGPEKFIVKIDGAATASRFQAVKARGYTTAAYWYDTSNWDNVPGKMPYVDLPGLNAQPTLAADSYWAILAGYGKPIWGHVITSQAGYNTAISKGARYVQVTDASVTPVGVEAWVPPTPVDISGLSLADAEVAWLRLQSGVSGMATLSDLRHAVYGESQHAWFAARSGLSFGSLADHKAAYYKAQTGTSGTLTDLARAFYAQELA